MSERAAAKAHGPRREIFTFVVGDAGYCIEIEHVLEIRAWTETTTMPQTPEYVTGLMNLRGIVVPVIDLSLRLGLGRAAATPRHVIIIVRVSDQTVGFLVQGVSDILTVEEGDLKPVPRVSLPATQSFVKGVYTLSDQLIRAVDVHQILPDRDGMAA
ncbi:chemotaxis protein CheW [Rhodalgimonas zhirmunskyi]|uniref:Chemotaxis protein CheW n=1 Tax=Rhodalgimonas zhirmunskyi TaxID=2964767 RepID=A0AAJ1UA19_9RHOB|nr:chemotaxis protein CheW [Rhodoalgimonas zhirmunskyi]MDQ2095714.1 chemotaxis protein CheW [Rhodoalgimonas zhirmunskyi]